MTAISSNGRSRASLLPVFAVPCLLAVAVAAPLQETGSSATEASSEGARANELAAKLKELTERYELELPALPGGGRALLRKPVRGVLVLDATGKVVHYEALAVSPDPALRPIESALLEELGELEENDEAVREAEELQEIVLDETATEEVEEEPGEEGAPPPAVRRTLNLEVRLQPSLEDPLATTWKLGQTLYEERGNFEADLRQVLERGTTKQLLLGAWPGVSFGDFARVVARTHQYSPRTVVVFQGVNPAVDVWGVIPAVQALDLEPDPGTLLLLADRRAPAPAFALVPQTLAAKELAHYAFVATQDGSLVEVRTDLPVAIRRD